MHIPDGVLPIWLILAGWALAVLLLALVSRMAGGGDSIRRLPLLGVMAAVMLVGMSTEIVPIAYHTNLSVLAGIVLGPTMAFLAAFIVNLTLALFGHGGITVVGLNTLVIAAEAILGFYLFRVAVAALGRGRPAGLPAFLATVVALLLSTLLMIGIVGVSNLDSSARVPVHTEELSFRNPFEHGLVTAELGAEAHASQDGGAGEPLDIGTFARLVLLLGSVGWLLEGVLTGLIASYVQRVRPDLLGLRARSPGQSPKGAAGSGRGSLPGDAGLGQG